MNSYLILKSLHLISMVAWFAGLFYIFRLFVYHRMKKDSREACELLEVMERKLLSYIILPASIATAFFGTWLLALNPALLKGTWIWIKLGLVAGLLGYQVLSGVTRKRFLKKDFYLSEKACRMINELPTLILIAVVFLAVLKPW